MPLHGTVGMAVDVERAHAADAFAAVVVEHYGFFALFNQLLVEHVEHFEEAAPGRHVVELVVDELSFLFWTTLTPNFQVYTYCMFHCFNLFGSRRRRGDRRAARGFVWICSCGSVPGWLRISEAP